MKHYQILQNDERVTAIKLNTAALVRARVTNSKNTLQGLIDQRMPMLWFNTNYFWKGKALGLVVNEGLFQSKMLNKGRPVFSFRPRDWAELIEPKSYIGTIEIEGRTLFEAGPMLVVDGEPCTIQGVVDGQFKDDAVRKTMHLAIGLYCVNREQRVVVAYFANHTLIEMATAMRGFGCTRAMKLDGGHSCCLRFRDPMASLVIDRGPVKVPTIGCVLHLSQE